MSISHGNMVPEVWVRHKCRLDCTLSLPSRFNQHAISNIILEWISLQSLTFIRQRIIEHLGHRMWSSNSIFHSTSRHPSLVNLHHFTYIEMSFVRLSRHGVLFVKHRQKHGQTSLHSTPTLPTQSTHHFNHHVWYTWINIHARFDVHQRTHHRALGALVVNCHQLSPDLPFEGLPSILGNLPSLRTHGQSIYETCTTRRAVHGAAEPIQRQSRTTQHSNPTLPIPSTSNFNLCTHTYHPTRLHSTRTRLRGIVAHNHSITTRTSIWPSSNFLFSFVSDLCWSAFVGFHLWETRLNLPPIPQVP